MATLKNDKLSIELYLKSQQAQEEIHRLTKATNELRKQNKEYRKERARLGKELKIAVLGTNTTKA